MEIQSSLCLKYVDPGACGAFSLRLLDSNKAYRGLGKKKSPVQIKCKNPFTPKLESENHHKLVNSIFAMAIGFLT